MPFEKQKGQQLHSQLHPLYEKKAETFIKFHAPVNYRDTWQIFRIMSEFVSGYQFLGELSKTATIFGSARSQEDSFAYKEARECGQFLGKQGFSIITGGGPGVMEAANRGAKEAGVDSIGLSIQLPEEQIINEYVTKNVGFFYFFIRKVMLVSPAEAGIFFPGGYGTLDEIFEMWDLIDLGKIKKIPMIAVGKDFWEPLAEFLKAGPLGEIGAISQENLNNLQIVNTAEEAAEIVRNSKVHKSLCNPTEEDCGQMMNWRIFRIMAELVDGFEFLTQEVRGDITFLGTKNLTLESPYYQAAEEIAYDMGKRGFMAITGGGFGIMEAANKGAVRAGAPSYGFSMKFDGKNNLNQYTTKSLSFSFPFIRKMILTVPSKAFIIFPGGLGTLHNLFEVLTLMKTKKIQEMPVILFGKKFWSLLDKYIKETLLKKYNTISPEYTEFYKIVDSVEEAEAILAKIQ